MSTPVAPRPLTIPQAVEAAYGHHRGGRNAVAERVCQAILRTDPGNADALHVLGLIASQAGEFEQAVALLRRAVATRPGAAEFRNNLATVLGQSGKLDEAVTTLREAVALAPDHADAHRNLALALAKSHRLADAIAPYRRALELRPDDVETWLDLSAVYRDLGRPDDANECSRRAVALRPADAAAHSDLLVHLLFAHGDDGPAMLREHLAWAARHARPLAKRRAPHRNDRTPDRRLRVGYVSADFREHPIGRFIAPALQHHSRADVCAVCYSDVGKPDGVTHRLRDLADEWHDVTRLTDEQLAARIREDRIDVLVDLQGHMEMRRLLAFARKPAPVQAEYIGHPATVGLDAIDYRITDAVHDPPGQTESFHVERLARLDGCCWAYDPMDDTEVGPPPADRSGHVTFGCLNRLVKLTPAMTRLWARILSEVPESRLMVLAERGTEPTVPARLAAGGVDPGQVLVVTRASRADYLQFYHAVDVALDTYPYTGMTTTCDALWMGVPTVTLAGPTHVSRVGLAIVSAVGGGDWAAQTPEEYLGKAVALAADRERLRCLRDMLRPAMRASPLMDGKRLARSLEEAYRRMWRQWCGGPGPGPCEPPATTGATFL